VVIGGPGFLVGATVSVEISQSANYRLAVEGALLTNIWPVQSTGLCPGPPCPVPRKPPYVSELVMVAMRGSVDIGGAWHAVGTAGFVTGNWARPQGMPGVALDLGWGVGRSSADR
jgi:hypothetical protein